MLKVDFNFKNVFSASWKQIAVFMLHELNVNNRKWCNFLLLLRCALCISRPLQFWCHYLITLFHLLSEDWMRVSWFIIFILHHEDGCSITRQALVEHSLKPLSSWVDKCLLKQLVEAVQYQTCLIT